MITDYLTEVRVYDQLLYRSVGPVADNRYEAFRNEQEIINDLLTINKKFYDDVEQLIKKGLDSLLEQKGQTNNQVKGLQYQSIQDMKLFKLYGNVAKENDLIKRTVFKERIVG